MLWCSTSNHPANSPVYSGLETGQCWFAGRLLWRPDASSWRVSLCDGSWVPSHSPFCVQGRGILVWPHCYHYCCYFRSNCQCSSSHLISSQSFNLGCRRAPQMTLQQYLKFPPFLVFRCPQGISKLHSRPFLVVIFPSLLLSTSHSIFSLSPSELSSPCQTILRCGYRDHLSFRFFTSVRRSSCTPIAFWIMRTSSFVTWS